MFLTDIIKLQTQVVIASVVIFFSLPFLPLPFEFNPTVNHVKLPEFTGPLAINSYLNKAEKLFENELLGPESLAVKGNLIYTGTRLGDIFEIDPVAKTSKKVANTGSKCTGFADEQNCGRVLGLRFDKKGDLYGIDAYKGLLKIDIGTGKVETLIPSGMSLPTGQLVFGDDLDIDDNGIIYYSVASTKWGLHQIIFLTMEWDTSGSIMSYDPSLKEHRVIQRNVSFPNGVQLSHDKKSLLYSELGAKRIVRCPLSGNETPDKKDIFSDTLPGGPDNIRLSPRGTYWVAFDSARSNSTPYIGDLIAPFPVVGKATVRLVWLIGQALKTINSFIKNPTFNEWAAEFEHGKILLRLVPSRGIIVEMDKSGKILRALHSTEFTLFSEVLELNNKLYIGSFVNPYLLTIPLPRN